LPEGATFVGTSGTSICRQTGSSLTCRNPREVTLAPGERERLVVTVRLPRTAQAGARNCVAIADALVENDADPVNNRQCVSVRVEPRRQPDIQALKIQTNDTCTPGESCTFDLWFINRGPGDHKGSPSLTDTLPAGATFEHASEPWSCQQSGHSLACGRTEVSIPPGRGVKVSVTVRLPADMATDARNCVRSPDHGRDPVPQNDEQCITIRTAPPPSPQEPVTPEEPHAPPVPQAPPPAPPIDTGADKRQLGPCKPGQSCLFELKFMNNGPGVWSGKAKLTDLLPDPNVQLGTWAPSTWNCTQTGASINCEHSDATIQPGEHLSLSMTLRLPDHVAGGAQNCVVIERPEIGHIDPHLLGDRKCVTIDMVTPGFAPRPPEVVQPSQPCPHGTVKQDGQCVTLSCPAGYELRDNQCYSTTQSCPAGYELRGDKCYSTQLTCPKGYVLRGKTCYPKQQQLTCPKGYVLRGKMCYPRQQQLTCPRGYVLRGRTCYPPAQRLVCPPGHIRVGALCINPNAFQQPHRGGGGGGKRHH
ncbi:MAG: hypothetical protein ACREGK_00345, partial [Geminicoccales bacterium]